LTGTDSRMKKKKKRYLPKVALSTCCQAKAVWDDTMPSNIKIHECLKCGKECDVIWVREDKVKEFSK
jgi:hypothetical protein